jgi:hypothetical protein
LSAQRKIEEKIGNAGMVLVLKAYNEGLSYEEARITFAVCARLMAWIDQHEDVSDDECVEVQAKFVREEILNAMSAGPIQ